MHWVNCVFALLFTPLLFAQTTKPDPAKFDRFVKEVYKGKGKKTMAQDTRRYAFMKDFFENRIRFVEGDEEKHKLAGYQRLSQVPLFDHYNKGLVRDGSFDPNLFNPFKYQLGFYDQESKIIYVDGTKYLIVIEPQKRGGSR